MIQILFAYVKFLIYLGFNNLLTEPTRVTESLIDLVFTNYATG